MVLVLVFERFCPVFWRIREVKAVLRSVAPFQVSYSLNCDLTPQYLIAEMFL